MDAFMGMITPWAPNFAPQGWQFCLGQTLAVSSNAALFSLLGTVYGGNGTTTFQLPNLAGRVPVGVGTLAGGSTYTLGEVGGTGNVTLTTSQMPIHTHVANVGTLTLGSITIKASNQDATDHAPSATASSLAAPVSLVDGSQIAGFNNQTPNTGLSVAATGTISGTVTNGTAGGSTPFSVVQPFLGLNYIICTSGLYPTRN